MEIVDPFAENGAPEQEFEGKLDELVVGAPPPFNDPPVLYSRNEAIETGRLIGERDADSRGEEKDLKDGRVRRAMMYAAWQFDGRPPGNAAQYEAEFGVAPIGSLRDAVGHTGADFKAAKKKKGES
jgi:hypothetical protein